MKDKKLSQFIDDTSNMVHAMCLSLFRRRKEYPADKEAMRLSRMEAVCLYDRYYDIHPTLEQAADTLEDEGIFPLLLESYESSKGVLKENLIGRYLNKINVIIEKKVFEKSISEYCVCPDFRCFSIDVEEFLKK